MAKIKRASANPISFRFSPEVLDVLNELAKADLPAMPYYGAKGVKKPIPKGWVIESCVHHYVYTFLTFAISERQLDSNLDSPDQILRLFIMYCKAQRGNKGYGFSTRNPETRFVYGPAGKNAAGIDEMVKRTSRNRGLYMARRVTP